MNLKVLLLLLLTCSGCSLIGNGQYTPETKAVEVVTITKPAAVYHPPLPNKINTKPVEMLGHVTSSYFSPNLNKSIALAVVKSGKKLKGKKLIVPMENRNINVTITDTVFYDKENKRLNA